MVLPDRNVFPRYPSNGLFLGRMSPVAKIDVQTEQEIPRGWTYHVVIQDDHGATTEHDVSLAWLDHDHWCGGRRPPSQVVEAVVNFVLDHGGPRPLPARFDAAKARWWIPMLDQELRRAL